jgi:hypothetical protein
MHEWVQLLFLELKVRHWVTRPEERGSFEEMMHPLAASFLLCAVAHQQEDARGYPIREIEK